MIMCMSTLSGSLLKLIAGLFAFLFVLLLDISIYLL
jgi:hypothetical protein